MDATTVTPAAAELYRCKAMKDAGFFWPSGAQHVIGDDGKPIKDAIMLTQPLPAGAIIFGHGSALALNEEQFGAMQKKRALKRNQPELDDDEAAAAEEAKKAKTAKKIASKVFETAAYMDASNRQLVMQAMQIATAPKPAAALATLAAAAAAPVAAEVPAEVPAPVAEVAEEVAEDSEVSVPLPHGLTQLGAEETRREEVTARHLERALNEHWDSLLDAHLDAEPEEEEMVEAAVQACTAAAIQKAVDEVFSESEPEAEEE
jgi:hypothetical protein